MENTSSSFDGFGGINREIYMEYVGIAKIMKMEVYEVMITNFEYELLAFWTSIVAHYSGQGIIHGRNMDYLLYQYMEDITYNGDFYKNGVKIYSAVMFAGYTGVFTAIKPEKFAISINERRPNGTLGLFFNLVGWMILTPSPAMHVRRICEQARNYTEAKNMLINKPITAPVYFTISGTEKNEGAIITRDRLSSADVWELNDQSSTDWVIVQTNYDHWISPAPTFDKNRADTAKESLKMLSRSGLNENTMMSNVIQKPPVKNQGTIYSTVMVPKTVSYFHFKIIYIFNYQINLHGTFRVISTQSDTFKLLFITAFIVSIILQWTLSTKIKEQLKNNISLNIEKWSIFHYWLESSYWEVAFIHAMMLIFHNLLVRLIYTKHSMKFNGVKHPLYGNCIWNWTKMDNI